jgi:hypothetical protein
MAVEFGARQLLATKQAEWLVRPVLYVSLLKHGIREHPLDLALLAGGMFTGLWLLWFLRAVPGQRLLPMRIGVGLILGAAIGLSVHSLVSDTSAGIFVLRLGAWRQRFGPFGVALLIGGAMVLSTWVLTSSLDDATAGARWRDLLLPRVRR